MKLKPKDWVKCGCILFKLVLTGCSASGIEATGTTYNALAISGALDTVNRALSSQNCRSAMISIQPVFNSTSSNNQVRMAMAATYGCFATVNIFTILSDMLSFSGDFSGSGFWEFMAKEFPSSATPTDDKIPQSAEFGIDALMAALTPGNVLISSDLINSTTNNPGSLLTVDRTDDANSYLTFMSMALMGSLENRYASPIAGTYHKSNNLPWTTAATTAGDGCAFASAVLNFFDGLSFIQTSASSLVSSQLSLISDIVPLLSAACNLGCFLCNGSNCTDSICPQTLRSRASCTGVTSDQNSCAAAGIITFVNAAWTTGPP